MSREEFFVGVDVGTASTRAGLFTRSGHLVSTHSIPIQIYSPSPGYFQQSSDEIWTACCSCVQAVTRGVPPEQVKGIGFDATCSLVAQSREPITVSPDKNPQQDIIMWMDHRAETQTVFVNKQDKEFFKSVGGKVSIEMQVPKLLWLKENLFEECWTRAERFFDLPDFLTWKATGCESRSLCSLACKWLYDASPEVLRWNDELYSRLGLTYLLEENARRIGEKVQAPGDPCGHGLSVAAAEQMGILPGTAVATSIIDAHAGGIGMIGCSSPGVSEEIASRLSVICGTSTCHMAVSSEPHFVEGVWGPYYSAMVPGLWLNEAGQSAAGKLIDHLIESNETGAKLKKVLGGNEAVVKHLNNLLCSMASLEKIPVDLLTQDMHIWPDFHGNRSPIADPTLRGMVSGLSLSKGEKPLALLYLASLQALAYGTRHIIEVLTSKGYRSLSTVLLCGGLTKNSLFTQTLANVLSEAVLIPETTESVLLGSAMLAATAARVFPDLKTAIAEMAGKAQRMHAQSGVSQYHCKKYEVFQRMLIDQVAYRDIMRT